MMNAADSRIATDFSSDLLMTLLPMVFGPILIRNRDVGDESRFAHGLAGEGRALLEPGARRGRAPQRLPARVLQRPAQRLMVMIARKIVAGVQLEPVAVGIPDIEEERVRDAVASGAALDVLQVTAGSHDVAEMQDVHRGRRPIGKVVQARAAAVGDGEVMDIALAVHPGGGDAPVRSVFLAIFGQPEAEPGVEVDRVLYFGRKDVEMAEPLRMAAFI